MYVLGTKVHNVRMSGAVKRAEKFLHDGKQHYIVTPNPEIVLHARKDRAYRAILASADLSIPDGIGLVWGSRALLGVRKALKERVSGVDFLVAFLRHLASTTYATDRTYRILFFGGRSGVGKEAARVFQRRFRHLGFFALENLHPGCGQFIINELIQPDCVFIAFGAPKQEQWIAENLSLFPTVKVAMGVGGAFDFISGRVPRAPRIMRTVGLEWFWRLLVQPWRIKRIYNAAVVFPLLVLKARPRG